MKIFSGRIAMLCIALTLAALIGVPPQVFALDDDTTSDSNMIGEVTGIVEIDRFGNRIIAKPREPVFTEDSIFTAIISKALLQFTDDSSFIVEDQSNVKLDVYSEGDKENEGETKLFLDHGAIKAMLGKNDITVNTPLAVAESIGKSKALNIVTFNGIGGPSDDAVKVYAGTYSCRSEGERPTVPVPTPDYIIDKYGPVSLLDFIVWEDTSDKDKRTFCVAVFEFEECEECERLIPRGVCIPDNNKPCDDGNPCTYDDICLGRECRGKRDPSPIDPACELDD
jgi:hypothetical protein